MSPILVRPVREQLEHDRIIRLLQTRLKRRYDVAINVGDEQTAAVRIGPGQLYPDLVLTSQDRGKRLEGIVEVETSESVNHLEAMAQWAHFGRARAPFYLYVPAVAVEIARRLCAENQVNVAELWSFHTIADQTRFTLIQRSGGAAGAEPKPPARAESEEPRAAAKERPKRPAATARRARKPARDEPRGRPSRKAVTAGRPKRRGAATAARTSSRAQRRK